MVIILPNFFLQKPVCRLLAVMGFLGFSGAIASQSSSPANIDSVKTYMKKDSFEKNVGSRFVTNRSIDSFGVSDTVDIKMLQRSQFLSIQQLLKGNSLMTRAVRGSCSWRFKACWFVAYLHLSFLIKMCPVFSRRFI